MNYGGQTPVCQFTNGKRCSEQALIDGACIPVNTAWGYA